MERDYIIQRHARNLAKRFGETLYSFCRIHLDETSRIIEDEFIDEEHYYDFQLKFGKALTRAAELSGIRGKLKTMPLWALMMNEAALIL